MACSLEREGEVQQVVPCILVVTPEPVRLDDLARNAGLSTSHFSEMFRAETGFSPTAYFTHLGIRQACRMLDPTPKRFKTIAVEAGCSDPYYFSRAFKKVMGLSPGKYRAIKKG
jgi:transcriptional regulator GlxA family with amidase domain